MWENSGMKKDKGFLPFYFENWGKYTFSLKRVENSRAKSGHTIFPRKIFRYYKYPPPLPYKLGETRTNRKGVRGGGNRRYLYAC